MRLAKWLVIAACALGAGGRARLAEAAEGAEAPDREAYKRRMQAGVRLFQAQDYRGALVEFEAAYQLSPRASPLINVALCERALFRYPRAIAALERALAAHRDTMEPADEAAARKAIDELRALVGELVVRGLPAGATLRIGDEEIATIDGPIALSPGNYPVTATAPGHLPRTEPVVVVSGAKVELELPLSPAVGTVVVIAAEKMTPILLDGARVGRGSYTAQVPVGSHEIELVGEAEPTTIEVRSNETSRYESPLRATGGASLPPVPERPPAPTPAEDPPKRGLYALVSGAVLVPTRHPDYFGQQERDKVSSGGSAALRAGYRVHTYAGFELLGEYMNVVGPANGTEEERYSLTSWRVGPLLRLQTGGDTLRFVGTLGGGFALNLIELDLAEGRTSTSGVDFFAVTEVGGELDLDGVLLGLSLAGYLSGTKGMNDFDGVFATRTRVVQEPYGNEVLATFGPRLSFGYAFW